jgi:hypothetical protein
MRNVHAGPAWPGLDGAQGACRDFPSQGEGTDVLRRRVRPQSRVEVLVNGRPPRAGVRRAGGRPCGRGAAPLPMEQAAPSGSWSCPIITPTPLDRLVVEHVQEPAIPIVAADHRLSACAVDLAHEDCAPAGMDASSSDRRWQSGEALPRVEDCGACVAAGRCREGPWAKKTSRSRTA